MARIVLSYRREETGGQAGRLYDRLVREFDDDQVFMDVDTIRPGEDFVEVIEQAIATSDVLLAVIGRRWTDLKDDEGNRRIDDPLDFVRLEIETALKRDVTVVPRG